MLAKIISGTTIGLEGVLIEVEVDVASRGFPSLTIVGLPNKAVDEAKDRVRTAIVNASFEMPDSRITVNLAPADIPKEGSAFDLPIAVGILAASGMIEKQNLKHCLCIGELSLEGNLRKVPGIISIISMAQEKKIHTAYIPYENAKEASLIDGVEVYAVQTLTDLILHVNKHVLLTAQKPVAFETLLSFPKNTDDFSDVKGQQQAKRALEIAASGFHNLHMKGPPGTGKTMLSRAFPSILPRMGKEEVLEVSKIYSIAGLLTRDTIVVERPFRSPHHTTSRIGLIGGGTKPAPGEISLAHRGVLFLDEFPEYPRSVLEALRQPLEDGRVTISRAAGSLTFPSRFLLLAASNPCPCGFLGHPKKTCRCMPGAIIRYKKRISGPLMDRIDLHVDVPLVENEALFGDGQEESSDAIRKRVMIAHEKQKKRFALEPTKTNGSMTTGDVKKYCKLTPDAIRLLKEAVVKLFLSTRSYFKIIKISQTIADLEGSETIEVSYIAEALQYRAKED